MKDLVNKYLDDHKDAWSASTMKSERSRLKGVEDILEKTPQEIHRVLIGRGQKAYTIKVTFTRLAAVETWALEQGLLKDLKFRAYMKKQRNRFKHAYQKEEIGVSYEEALKRINLLDEPFKTQALDMLKTGVRLDESYKVRNGKVVGKGGKARTIFGTIRKTAPRSTFSRHLKSVGLKSHMLRKLCATRLGENGAQPADLCKVFGWSHIGTAYHYLQSKDDARLQTLIQEASEEK